MFTPETIIDTVQKGNKQIVDTFVFDKNIKTGLNDLIDAHTSLVKTVTKNVQDITKTMTEQYVKAVKTV
jgi:hypothetical protein